MRTSHDDVLEEMETALRGLRRATVFVLLTTIASAVVLIVRAMR